MTSNPEHGDSVNSHIYLFLINVIFDRDMVVSITMHLQVAAL